MRRISPGSGRSKPNSKAHVAAAIAEGRKVVETWRPLDTVDDYRTRYGDQCVADALPRAVLYLDIGYLAASLESLRAGGALTLTPSQLMALRDIVAHYLTIPTHSEVFVDVHRDVETTPEELLALLMRPTRHEP
jgi:hypothetical protein